MRPCPALSLALAVTLGAVSEASSADLPSYRARGSLRVLVAADEQPEAFSFQPDTPPGLERELVEGFARLEQLRVEVLPVKRFAEIIPMLKSGKGDLITGIIVTDERRQEIDFTEELLPVRFVSVSRAPRPAVASVEQLRGETVGVIPGNAWAKAVAEAGVPAARTVSFAGVSELMEALRDGRISATVMALSDYILVQRRDAGLHAGVFLGGARSAAWGLRKEDGDLKRALDAYLQGTRRSGAWNRLVVKYYGEAALAVLGRARQQ